jgi:hypothetical protein
VETVIGGDRWLQLRPIEVVVLPSVINTTSKVISEDDWMNEKGDLFHQVREREMFKKITT